MSDSKSLKIEILSGEHTCITKEKKRCPFFGSTRFGTIPVCLLFPSKENSHTELTEGFDGWIQRTKDCKEAQL